MQFLKSLSKEIVGRGMLDCEALGMDLCASMPNRKEVVLGSYVMFNITVDELCPEISTLPSYSEDPMELVDWYLMWGERLRLENEPSRALAVLDKVAELHEKHDLKVSVEFLFKYAEVAFSAKAYEAALQSVQKYLARAESNHGDHRSALRLREAVQEKVAKFPLP